MLEIDLPWFPSDLMPNKARTLNYHERGRIAKAYKEQCGLILNRITVPELSGKISCEILFFPPDLRRRDIDGMLSAIKPAIDAVAIRLEVDDYNFRPITIDTRECVDGGLVKIILKSP